MADIDFKTLSLMTTAEGMAAVLDAKLTADMFEDPFCEAGFVWMLDYHQQYGQAPTLAAFGTDFPSVKLPPPSKVDEPAGFLVEALQRRYVVNQAQDMLRKAGRDIAEDPVAALTLLAQEAREVVEKAGRTGPSYDDEFLRADQLGSLPIPDPLISDVLTRHAYGILRGRDATYKSFVALDWSLCLATGTAWQGKPAQRVRVLYVAGEGAYGVAARVRAWEKATGVTIEPEWFVVRRSAVNLFRPGLEFDHLLAYVRDGEFGLVVLDTLRRMSGGAEGNGSDMGTVVDNIERIKRESADGSVLTIAHTDKGDNDTRGFSGIEDDADIVWSTKREANTNDVTLACEKMKDGPDGHRFELRLRPESDSLVVESAQSADRSNLFAADRQTDQTVMAAMREVFAVDGATVPDLVELTGLSRSTIFRVRSRLLGSGRLRSDKSHRLFLHTIEAAQDE